MCEILGMTISQMRTTLTYSEYSKWMLYLNNKEPSITELQLAMLSTLVSNGLGGKHKLQDFIISKPTTNKPIINIDNKIKLIFGDTKKLK